MEKKSKVSSILRIGGLSIVVVAIVAAIAVSMNNKPTVAERIWYDEMTLGEKDAENYFVIYSDIACPYCIAFENTLVEHHDELMKYLAANNILLEVRLSDFLYEFGESNPIESRYGAVATYCAKDRGKFWDYYNLAVTKVWNEYFKDAGKAAFTEFNKLGTDYWVEIGEKVGLSDDFARCVENGETLDVVKADAKKMSRLASGMPYFKFNDYVLSGFDLSWGWEYVKMYFDAGLKS